MVSRKNKKTSDAPEPTSSKRQRRSRQAVDAQGEESSVADAADDGEPPQPEAVPEGEPAGVSHRMVIPSAETLGDLKAPSASEVAPQANAEAVSTTSSQDIVPVTPVAGPVDTEEKGAHKTEPRRKKHVDKPLTTPAFPDLAASIAKRDNAIQGGSVQTERAAHVIHPSPNLTSALQMGLFGQLGNGWTTMRDVRPRRIDVRAHHMGGPIACLFGARDQLNAPETFAVAHSLFMADAPLTTSRIIELPKDGPVPRVKLSPVDAPWRHIPVVDDPLAQDRAKSYDLAMRVQFAMIYGPRHFSKEWAHDMPSLLGQADEEHVMKAHNTGDTIVGIISPYAMASPEAAVALGSALLLTLGLGSFPLGMLLGAGVPTTRSPLKTKLRLGDWLVLLQPYHLATYQTGKRFPQGHRWDVALQGIASRVLLAPRVSSHVRAWADDDTVLGAMSASVPSNFGYAPDWLSRALSGQYVDKQQQVRAAIGASEMKGSMAQRFSLS